MVWEKLVYRRSILGDMKMREKVLLGAIEVVKRKGVKFTMDDVAHELGMSKKTIYVAFRDKKSLLMAMADYLFDKVKESEAEILNNESLSLEQKIRMILGVLPDGYREFSFNEAYALRNKYPEIYAIVQKRIESDWDTTISLFQEGVKAGIVREIDFRVFQITFEAAVERLLMSDELDKMGIEYADALDELVSIMVDGILAK